MSRNIIAWEPTASRTDTSWAYERPVFFDTASSGILATGTTSSDATVPEGVPYRLFRSWARVAVQNSHLGTREELEVLARGHRRLLCLRGVRNTWYSRKENATRLGVDQRRRPDDSFKKTHQNLPDARFNKTQGVTQALT